MMYSMSNNKRSFVLCNDIKVAWKVNGLKSKHYDKTQDSDFLNELKPYDIIGLIETHGDKDLEGVIKRL